MFTTSWQLPSLRLTLTSTVAEPSDSHAGDLHSGGGAGLPADRLPHRQRQRSGQGEPERRDLGAQMQHVHLPVARVSQHTTVWPPLPAE